MGNGGLHIRLGPRGYRLQGASDHELIINVDRCIIYLNIKVSIIILGTAKLFFFNIFSD